MRRWVIAMLLLCASTAGLATRGDATVPPEDRPRISYRLEVPRIPRVCEGRTLKVAASVVRVVRAPASSPAALHSGLLAEEDGVPITATVADPSIVTPARSVEITGWPTFSGPPSKATFRFKGEKAGETSVHFVANISGMRDFGWPGDLVDGTADRSVRVRRCRFKVSVSTEWAVPGEANLEMSASMVEADVRSDNAGVLSGVGQVNWSTSTTAVGDCSGALLILRSTANITGTIDDEGVVSLKVDYAPASLQFDGTCGAFSGTATPAPLLIEGLANSTIQDTLPQSLSTVGPVPPGEANFFVRPLDDEAP